MEISFFFIVKIMKRYFILYKKVFYELNVYFEILFIFFILYYFLYGINFISIIFF